MTRAAEGVAIACALLILALSARPADTPKQPIPFSHRTHVSLALSCGACHANPDPGEAMTIPGAPKCMICHVAVARDRPAIQALARYGKDKKDVPWVRVYAVPEWVFWSHRTHLEAKITCQQCHGDVGSMTETVRPANIVPSVTTMGGCVGCHQKSSGVSTGCQTCHENRSS